ncbi:MAG: stage III sporulation protein AG [Clostridiales bacterium]|nr:stage III sporulation protein AG [Roseburia sp.]MDD7638152.1 stage III sporulation protein AG [Clostridiales bacterium]MDY4111287.1 stage III sporulation protein AG [Roseburia sp.]
MNMQELKSFFREKKWKDLKKSDWVVIGLIGVLLLVIAMPMEERKSEEKSRENAGGQVVYDSSNTEGAGQEKGLENGTGGMTEDAYVEYLEKKLEAVLGQMDGVGNVEVMITVSDRGEYVVEKDTNSVGTITTEEDSAGGSRTVSENTVEEATIYVENGEETYPYIQKEKMPTVEGVVVVAEGGGNSLVVSNISESVKALLPVEAHRIKVVKMCSKEE